MLDDVVLERPAMRLTVAPGLGARIVSLLDRRTGREWLAQGHRPSAEAIPTWSSDGARFGAGEAFGWDECLPTVAASSDPLSPDAAPLRDHGSYWGREAPTHTDEGAIVTEWPPDIWGLRFARRLRLDSSAVLADYALHNPNAYALPFLWSGHPLLRLEDGARLHLPRIDRVRIQATHNVDLAGPSVGWPRTQLADGRQLDLDVVQDAGARIAIKAFAAGLDGRAGALCPDGSWVGLAWDAGFAPMLGVWLNYAAWPELGSLHHVALEPTTSGQDALTDAIAAGQAATLEPGRTIHWWMRMEVGTQPSGLGAFLRG